MLISDELTPAERLTLAWENMFSANATRDQARLVLRDLMGITGFYAIAGPSASGDQCKYLDGQRSVYFAILQKIEGSDTANTLEREARRMRPATG